MGWNAELREVVPESFERKRPAALYGHRRPKVGIPKEEEEKPRESIIPQ
jgi:hypothetical protein